MTLSTFFFLSLNVHITCSVITNVLIECCMGKLWHSGGCRTGQLSTLNSAMSAFGCHSQHNRFLSHVLPTNLLLCLLWPHYACKLGLICPPFLAHFPSLGIRSVTLAEQRLSCLLSTYPAHAHLFSIYKILNTSFLQAFSKVTANRIKTTSEFNQPKD